MTHFYAATPKRLVPCEIIRTVQDKTEVMLSGWTKSTLVQSSRILKPCEVMQVKKVGGGVGYVARETLNGD